MVEEDLPGGVGEARDTLFHSHDHNKADREIRDDRPPTRFENFSPPSMQGGKERESARRHSKGSSKEAGGISKAASIEMREM